MNLYRIEKTSAIPKTSPPIYREKLAENFAAKTNVSKLSSKTNVSKLFAYLYRGIPILPARILYGKLNPHFAAKTLVPNIRGSSHYGLFCTPLYRKPNTTPSHFLWKANPNFAGKTLVTDIRVNSHYGLFCAPLPKFEGSNPTRNRLSFPWSCVFGELFPHNAFYPIRISSFCKGVRLLCKGVPKGLTATLTMSRPGNVSKPGADRIEKPHWEVQNGVTSLWFAIREKPFSANVSKIQGFFAKSYFWLFCLLYFKNSNPGTQGREPIMDARIIALRTSWPRGFPVRGSEDTYSSPRNGGQSPTIRIVTARAS